LCGLCMVMRGRLEMQSCSGNVVMLWKKCGHALEIMLWKCSHALACSHALETHSEHAVMLWKCSHALEMRSLLWKCSHALEGQSCSGNAVMLWKCSHALELQSCCGDAVMLWKCSHALSGNAVMVSVRSCNQVTLAMCHLDRCALGGGWCVVGGA